MPAHYKRANRAVSRQAHGNVYVLPTASHEVVVLTGTGTELWNLFADPMTVDQVARLLADAYGVPAEAVGRDVASAVADLIARDVLVAA